MIRRLLIIHVLGICLTACSSNNPIDQQGAMAPCPSSPNCVSSRGQDDAFISPFVLTGVAQQSWPSIIDILMAMPRTEIIEQSPGYVHATASSRIFSFVDDMELELVSDGKTIDIRSASRTGYSDMGVNRKRMEQLREMLSEAGLIE